MEQKVGSKAVRCLRIAAAWLIAVILVLPFVWMLMLSLKTNSEILLSPAAFPKELQWSNYVNAIHTLPLWTMSRNTFINILLTIGLTMLIVYPASYALARIPFHRDRTSKRVYNFLILGLMIPVYILIFPIYRVNMILNTIGTRMAVILPLTATNISFDILLLTGALRDIPGEIEESAIMDGASLPTVCVRIAAPLIVPTIVAVFLFNTLYVWNEYMFTSLFLTDRSLITLSMGTSLFQGQYSMDYAGMIAATVLVMLPQLLFYCLFQKQIIKGLTAGAVKG